MFLLGALFAAAAVQAEDEKAERLRLHVLRDVHLGYVRPPGRTSTIEPLAIGWNALQEAQRGHPEDLFHEKHNPGISLCGPVQFALEHGGDLVHRAAFGDWGGGWSYGIEALGEKADKLYRWVKAAQENPRDNPEACARKEFRYLRDETERRWIPAAFLDIDEEEAIRRWYAALARYVEAYRGLAPRSRLQRIGRSIAVDIGRLDLAHARGSLAQLRTVLDDAQAAGEQAEFDLYYRDIVPPSRFR